MNNLDSLILAELELFDEKQLKDESFLKWIIPRITGEILKKCNFGISGKLVVTAIKRAISKGEELDE